MDNALAEQLINTLKEMTTIIYSRLTDIVAMAESLKDTVKRSGITLEEMSARLKEIESTLYNHL